MSGPDEGSQPQQARLAQALHDFAEATDQAVRAWAGELTVRQALDITYVITDLLRLLGSTAERLSRYGVGNEPEPDHDAGPDLPGKEIARAGASIGAARAALVFQFQEAYRASGGWPEPGGDPARDGTAVFVAHLLYERLSIADESWPELSGMRESRNRLVEALICATDGLAWGIQNLARDAPGPMHAGLIDAVAHLDDTFAHLREASSAPQSGISPHRTPGNSTTTYGLPSRFPGAPRRSAPGMPAARRTPPAPPPWISCALPPALRRCGPRDGSGGQPRRRALAPITPIRAEGKPWTSPITSG